MRLRRAHQRRSSSNDSGRAKVAKPLAVQAVSCELLVKDSLLTALPWEDSNDFERVGATG
jgi:hypothetical protein